MSNITPEEWGRDSWLALCDDHLKLYLEEDKDIYGEVMDSAKPLNCDHKNCNKEAKWELYPNLIETISNINSDNYVPLNEVRDDIDE